MNNEQKKQEIKNLVSEMIEESRQAMLKKIDIVLNSGAIDVDQWEPDNAPMVLPKTIVTAILQHESEQRDGKGTSHERKIKKEVRNIRYWL